MIAYSLRNRILCSVVAVLAIAACADDPTEPASTVEEAATFAATTAEPLSFYQISASNDFWHTCALTMTNQGYCWGTGFLGDGPAYSTRRLTPVAVSGGHQFRMISTGLYYTCALTTDNRAFCWGNNESGQLGDGTTVERPEPVAAAPSLRFRQIAAGHVTTCGLTTENRVYCWGSSVRGQMGTGTATATGNNPPTEIAGGRTYIQVSSAYQHSCALTPSHEIYCWGRGDTGELGDSSTAKQRNSPSRVSGNRDFIQVSAGHSNTCAVTSGGKAFCWGWGHHGTNGDGSTLDRWEPRQVASTVLFDRVTAGGATTCAESRDNRAYCWGYNEFGQVGDGTTTTRLKPVAVAGGLFFAQVSAGANYSCGVTPDQRGYCWGGNRDGTLGDGTTTDRSTLTTVSGPS